ncbi:MULTISPECIES: cation:dicarboxylate symporter family transporter [Paraclostridium]|jgi:L-cystine uptake protein TcyP (sodium:dicarboxylate symporter family)|uniref:L-cystine uptake protein TcyP n=1 Tax=Paraclostridium bifermentans TaxID=1490 RepID=A0A5P3XC79_PARBF|nr:MULTISPECIES: cation:dicarboxylase symporter family transporter [Paraclostridium]EQK44496.1 dicarboxylate family transmembrane symporter [[Clostridium] bifermentans ATCC 19299] [Paraclostridium bifermentans ATCC 19299]MBS5955045.1 cation:dicarboxylase symporter family transporter [Paraclostridium bifermentans]MBS6509995.1 cation:dicarboxylase symporter family transporter [Paraclostridium bifermentans]MBU5290059.1 cation:dicarboxylase symporter family transporter [Paraclostridium bifermentans
MNYTFFSEFLMVTNWLTLLSVGILIGLFFIVKKLTKKLNFTKLMISSIAMGIGLGLIIQFIAGFPNDPTKVTWLTEVSKWYGLFGYGFMDLLKMLVVPLVFVSIVRVIMNLKQGENLGKLTGRTIFMLLGTTAIAAAVGIIVGNLFKLGVGQEVAHQATEQLREVTPVVDTLRGLLPSNPVDAMAQANVVAIVIFAGFIGIAIKRLSKKHADTIKPFVDLIEAFYKIIISISITVIKLMPYAVVALMASSIIDRGISSIVGVIDFILALYVSVAIMFIVHLIIISINGVNPIKYLKNASKPLILAFTSRSSLGTLPVTIETLNDNLKVDQGISSFVGSLGANMGMNGCAGIYPALMAVTVANMSGTTMNFSFYVMLLIVITISSLGIAGIPGTATMSVSVVISGMGLGAYFPLLGGIIAIDPILDMGRTMLNVNGAMASTIAVANSFDEIDKNSIE